jgi:hypothetical protein
MGNGFKVKDRVRVKAGTIGGMALEESQGREGTVIEVDADGLRVEWDGLRAYSYGNRGSVDTLELVAPVSKIAASIGMLEAEVETAKQIEAVALERYRAAVAYTVRMQVSLELARKK